MLDLVVIRHIDEEVLRRASNIKLDTAAREFMIACALSLRTGQELEVAVRPHDPRRMSPDA